MSETHSGAAGVPPLAARGPQGEVAALVSAHASDAGRIGDTIGAALARAHELQPVHGAFAAIDDAGARAGAAAVEARLASGEASLPLAGVPVSVKDILDVAGLPTRWGSPLFAQARPAAADIAAVARLRGAGAVILGKTTTTEFAHSPLGTSPLTGLTRNPFAPELTCGGSSSGAGVSVATGLTPVALATDAGCSTRLPAACTGTYGFKPTLGLIPHEKVPDAFGSFIHLGLIARHVADIAAVLPVVAGPHAGDPWSQRPRPVAASAPEAPLRGASVLLWLRTGNSRVSQEVEAATLAAAGILEALGARVQQEDYAFAHPDPIWSTLQQTNWALRFAATPEAEFERLSPTLKAGIAAARGYSGLDLQRAQVARTALYRAVQGKLGQGFDFILTPCVSVAPVAADFDLAAPLVVDGVEAGPLRSEWTAALSLFDLAGNPAIAMPVGFAANGGPLGVQLVAGWNQDLALLAAARAFEAACPPPRWTPAT